MLVFYVFLLFWGMGVGEQNSKIVCIRIFCNPFNITQLSAFASVVIHIDLFFDAATPIADNAATPVADIMLVHLLLTQ